MTKRLKPPIDNSSLHRGDASFRQWFATMSGVNQDELERTMFVLQERLAKASGAKVGHVIRAGRVPGGYSAWTSLRTVDHAVHLLAALRVGLVGGVNDAELTLNAAIEASIQITLRRTLDLVSAMTNLWESRHELAAAILSRAIVETIAVFDTVVTHVVVAHEADDLQAMATTLKRAIWGMQSPSEDHGDLPRPVRVTEAVRQLGTRQQHAEKFYAQISNIVHPNGGGTLPWIAADAGSALDFRVKALLPRERFVPIYNALLCLPYWLSQDIDALKEVGPARPSTVLP